MDSGVVVECVHPGQQLCLGHGGVVLFQDGVQTGIVTGLDLVAYINLGSGVVTHQHHGQARCQATGLEGGAAGSDVLPQLLGQSNAIYDLGGLGHVQYL